MANRKPAKKTVSSESRRAPKTRTSPAGKKSKPVRDVECLKQYNQIYAVVMFALSILMVCLVLINGNNVWLFCHNTILGLFGCCAIIWPILLLYISIVTALERQKSHLGGKVVLMVIIITLFCAAVYIFTTTEDTNIASYGDRLLELYKLGIQRSGAGLFSGLVGIPFVAAFGFTGAKIFIVLIIFVALMILTGTSLVQLFHAVTKPADIVAENISNVYEQRAIERARKTNSNIDIALDSEDAAEQKAQMKDKSEKTKTLKKLEKVFGVDETMKEKDKSAGDNSITDSKRSVPVEESSVSKELSQNQKEQKPESGAVDQMTMFSDEPPQDGSYHFPPITMLETTKQLKKCDVSEELKINGQMLIQTLNSFGVKAKIVNISRGPAVTRYELQPGAGVKISKITNLSDDIAMNLAASGVRIEAPIPGKAAVGIEVPNKKINIVRMRELIESNSFGAAKSRLTVILGKNISGEVATADLSKMPHLLIAGATGSGKSVCINSFIVSLLYKSTPDEVRFLMIDPKVVELGIYNGIPQLLVPVVTDPRKAAGALNWAVTEMLKRYKTFAENNVRDLNSYNKLAASKDFKDDDGQPMPRLPKIVIIIDELADLMMAAPNEVEDSICRLAQMARAAGMHLLIATQRPSVDVITGIIKANIPSRIAFAVSSQVDSRTILDIGGAEKLLGRGDMLFSPVGSQKPIRIQGCFVSDSEIESVVSYVKKSQETGYDQNIADEIEKNAVIEKKSKTSGNGNNDDTDPKLSEAIKCVVEAGQASTSFLQRRLRLGYARAGRLIDEMEQMGIIGPRDGAKPRKLLITYQQWLEMTMQKSNEKESEVQK